MPDNEGENSREKTAEARGHQNDSNSEARSQETKEKAGSDKNFLKRKRKDRSPSPSSDSPSTDDNESSSDSDKENADFSSHDETDFADYEENDDYQPSALLTSENEAPPLTKGQWAHVEEFFCKKKKELALKEVMEASPVEPEKLDHAAEEILKGANHIDRDLAYLHKKVLDVMGPLSVAWSVAIDKQKKGKGKSGEKLLKSVEKSVALLGQAHVAVLRERRLNLLQKVFRSRKDAVSHIYTSSDLLDQSSGNVFGKKYLKSKKKILMRYTKRSSNFSNYSRNSNRGQSQYRRFRGTPSAPSATYQAQRGGFSNSSRPRGTSRGRRGFR